MYVTYFDEVKAMPANGQNSYFVGGICVPMANVPEIERELVLYAERLFNSSELSPETKSTRAISIGERETLRA